jgi:hypothetical protein
MRASGERLTVEELRYKARTSRRLVMRIAAELGVKLVPSRQAAQPARGRKRVQDYRPDVLDRLEEARALRTVKHKWQLEEARRRVAKRKGTA